MTTEKKDYKNMTLNQLENEFIIGVETLAKDLPEEDEDESSTVNQYGDSI